MQIQRVAGTQSHTVEFKHRDKTTDPLYIWQKPFFIWNIKYHNNLNKRVWNWKPFSINLFLNTSHVQAEISLSVILLMACSFRGFQRKTVNVIGNTRSRIHQCLNAAPSFKFQSGPERICGSITVFNPFANQVKYRWKKKTDALYSKSTASCWKNRTCSTAVRRTCGCKHRVGEPGDTS